MPSNETLLTDYRSTLNLPKTDFPMRAELAKREPERVDWWQAQRVYERRLERNAGNSQWILHDGPPYANGDVHMGGFLNRVLKDIFVKVHLLDGAYARFVPGWDMHGLPIEFETLRHLGIDFHAIDPIALRAACRERALYWLDRQRETFLRMGLLGDYAHPYRTIDKNFEATIVDTLADLAEARQLYRGLRATLWCMRDETALAEAEIEYKERVSPSIYARFFTNDAQNAELLRRSGIAPSEAGGLPLSDRHLDDDAVDAAGKRCDRVAPRCCIRRVSPRRRIVVGRRRARGRRVRARQGDAGRQARRGVGNPICRRERAPSAL